jgi:hypothetical protein
MPKCDGIVIPYFLAIPTVRVLQSKKSVVLFATNQTDIAQHENDKSVSRILAAQPS